MTLKKHVTSSWKTQFSKCSSDNRSNFLEKALVRQSVGQGPAREHQRYPCSEVSNHHKARQRTAFLLSCEPNHVNCERTRLRKMTTWKSVDYLFPDEFADSRRKEHTETNHAGKCCLQHVTADIQRVHYMHVPVFLLPTSATQTYVSHKLGISNTRETERERESMTDSQVHIVCRCNNK